MPCKRRSSSSGKKASNKKSKTVEVAETPSPALNTASLSLDEGEAEAIFVGDPFPAKEARLRWPHRYLSKNTAHIAGEQNPKPKGFADSDEVRQAKQHFSEAKVDGCIYKLNDEAYVQGEMGNPHFICRIVEMFQGVDEVCYFRAQWFYRAEDTVIKNSFKPREHKRVFLSEVQDDNPLDCLVQKLHIIRLHPNEDVVTKMTNVPDCDYYYDMLYVVPYATFLPAPNDDCAVSSGDQSTISTELDVETSDRGISSEMRLLDLYSGCGAMSTGLCLGANIYGVNLITKWAVDLNNFACESLKLNHTETEVRNESVEDFLALLKEWKKLCMHFSLIAGSEKHEALQTEDQEDDSEDNDDDNSEGDGEVFEVEKVLAICYGDPKDIQKPGLYMKVHWKGYGSDDDTWEPVEGLSHCQDKLKEFVKSGFEKKLLPLPGDVDAICGGPPCQGISGFNRFRDTEEPLRDPKNRQLIVYMDVVDYLKPKYVLMENVVDMVKFGGGILGRYALGRLVDMNYQARMGMMAAGSYGLPQFRMRVFLWGARHTEKLPQYALPTHDVVNRGVVPTEFEKILVAHDDPRSVELKEKLFLVDAISDLPEVQNSESRDDVPFNTPPNTNFQHFIRMKKNASYNAEFGDMSTYVPNLFDHIPLRLNTDDLARVCQIPKKKGANFRDLPGVRLKGSTNVIEWDPDVPRVLLPSGKPLIPDYAVSFVKGTSTKPFGRLWWDETVPTVIGRAEPHNHALLHPSQDRVLTVRENARLQGFPDHYKLQGPIKQRYIQVGNAVAVPVARALGYSLAKASHRDVDDEALFTLPQDFPKLPEPVASPSTSEDQV